MDLEHLPEHIRQFLAEPRHAVIATLDADGQIRQAVVWYALTDEGIVMNALAGRRWPANIERDPRLSLTVFDGEDYVILRGAATVIDDPGLGLREAMALSERYGGDPSVHLGQHRVRIVFEPRDIALHGALSGKG